MAASVNDYFQKLGGASSLVNTPKVTATRAPAGATLTVDNCNWDSTTGKRFATFQVDTSGAVVAGTETIWKGVVSSTTSIGSLARVAGAADTGNAIGDYVMLLPASDWGNQIVAGLLVQHNQDGTHGAVTATSLSTSAAVTAGNGLTVTAGNVAVPNTSTAFVVPNHLMASTGTTWVWQSWTPTLTGFSANPASATYFWTQIGKTVIAQVRQPNTGTSNSGSFTITLPATASANTPLYLVMAQISDNGVASATPGMVTLSSGSNVASVFKDLASGSFTASGGKRATFQIIYEAA